MRITSVEPKDKTGIPLVARFATIRFDIDEEASEHSVYMTGKGIFGTDPTTYSATTKSGNDQDTDDTGQD